MENLPDWVFALYYLFLVITLLGILYTLFRKQIIIFSLVAFFALLTVSSLSMLLALERTEGFNEFEWIMHEVIHGSPQAIYAFVGFFYLFFWWGLVLKIGIRRTHTKE